jgi:hypothetical protein
MNMKRMILLAAAMVLPFAVIGCSTPATRIHANPEAFARLPADQQTLVSNGQVAPGFTMEAVRLALGAPDRVTTRVAADGRTTIWHYVNYEAVGGPMYFPGYAGWYRGWGGWGGWYPYYMDYPTRWRGHDTARVEFRGDRVTSVTTITGY